MNEFLLEKYHDLLKNESIDPKLYDEFRVKRGLRNDNGTGVLVGLTKVAEVSGYTVCNDEIKPKKGNLYYRGIDITKVSKMCGDDFGYENTLYIHNTSVVLPKNQGKLLVALLASGDALVTTEQLCLALWGTTEYIDENALQVNLTRLKKTMSGLEMKQRIVAVRGMGYRLETGVAP